LIVACLAVAVSALPLLRESDYQREFQSFVSVYNKAYDTNQFFARFAIFKDNLDYINEVNGQNLTYTLGVNEFSDLTHHEFRAIFNQRLPKRGGEVEDIEIITPNADVDWRAKGAVTPVKNQGQCGSCWAFSATGAIESFTFLKTQQLLLLAEQQMVDCCHDQGSAGCNGGEESAAIGWVGKNGGQCLGKDYPYTARNGQCKKTCVAAAKVGGVKEITGEPALITSITNLPTTVAVDASARDWQSYRGGTFAPANCGKQLNHAILAVGYTDQYYIVKNSWGTTWGASGYVMIVRGKNMCGIALEPSFPV